MSSDREIAGKYRGTANGALTRTIIEARATVNLKHAHSKTDFCCNTANVVTMQPHSLLRMLPGANKMMNLTTIEINVLNVIDMN